MDFLSEILPIRISVKQNVQFKPTTIMVYVFLVINHVKIVMDNMSMIALNAINKIFWDFFNMDIA
jgi:hypothetical protein